MTARSARWNSGRLESISATVSPRRTPSPASPPASASTRSRSSPQVSETSSSLVRTATRAGNSSAVMRKASAIDRACRRRETAAAVVAMPPTLPDPEAIPRQPADVVGEADEEQHEHQREAHETGPLHHAERDRAPAHLLRQRPEDVAAVEREEREQVDHAERQRDDREQIERLCRADLDALARGLVRAHHPGELLALLGLE